jgi:hypothetical protein
MAKPTNSAQRAWPQSKGPNPDRLRQETADQRAGQETEVVGWQLAEPPKPFTGVVAYEPVWAVSTGKTPRRRIA